MPSVFQRLFANGFLRFCVIGGSSAVAALVLLYIAVDVLHLPYLPAFIVILVLVNVYAYAASRRFAFSNTSVGIHAGLARYLAISAISIFFNAIALMALVELLELRPVIASALIAVANAPLNFLLHRKITFSI